MIRRLFLQWFWDLYDALGRFVVINLMLSAGLGAIVLLGIVPALKLAADAWTVNPAAGALGGFVVWALGCAAVLTLWLPGLLELAGRVSSDHEPAMRDFWNGLRKKSGRCFRLAIFWAVVWGVIGVNALFYLHVASLPGPWKIPSATLAGLCFWVLLFSLGIASYSFPVAVRVGSSARESLKLAGLMVLRYPFFTLWSTLSLASMWAVSILPFKTAPLWVLGVSATAVFMNSMYDVVVLWEEKREKAQAEAREAEQLAAAGAEGASAGKPVSWKQIREKEKAAADGPRDRYDRTLRDIMKPWEYS